MLKVRRKPVLHGLVSERENNDVMKILNHNKGLSALSQRQRGIALPLVAVGLLAMLAVAGLALDTSHALANKTRLQNTTDAAALAAAKEFDRSGDIVLANVEAMSLFGLNADGAGNHELNDAYDASEISVIIQWSKSLNPFVSTGEGPYVRVRATGYQINTSLTAVLGITDIDISASAVAGPSPNIVSACNVAPLVACAPDKDAPLFGFELEEVDTLKFAGGDTGPIGPGNYNLIRLSCGAGGDCVRENLAGAYDGCTDGGDTVETETGVKVGPVVQGLNTRFNEYGAGLDSADYPPDVVVNEPPSTLWYDEETDTVKKGPTADPTTVDKTNVGYGWTDYKSDVDKKFFTNPPPEGEFERRVLAIPISDCDGGSPGHSTLPVIGFACYFILQKVTQKGNEAHIFGQFIDGCTAGGAAGPNPGTGPGIYLIQLYKNPGSTDS